MIDIVNVVEISGKALVNKCYVQLENSEDTFPNRDGKMTWPRDCQS